MVDFSFSPQKVWNLDVSISSRIMRFVCTISLSLLETRENTFGFLFSSRNWRKYLKFLHFFCKSSRSLLEPENRSRHFSFLFSKLEMWIPYFSFSSRFDFLASRQCLPFVSIHISILFQCSIRGYHPLRQALPSMVLIIAEIQFGTHQSVNIHSPACVRPVCTRIITSSIHLSCRHRRIVKNQN